MYTDEEYAEYFSKGHWSKSDTDNLFDLCQRFDLRWSVIHDRWPSHLSPKSMEELKARYYEITNQLKKVRILLFNVNIKFRLSFI